MVTEQLDRILSSSQFKQSKRYPLFLRYVVEETLLGREASLKERTLGVEVFGRDPHYDSNSDPIVRVSAGEVRKRIAQYYHQPGHERELRIDLSPGSYVPEFQPFTNTLPEIAVPRELAQMRQAGRGSRVAQKAVVPLAICLLFGIIVAVAGFYRGQAHRPSALEQWWHPLLNPSVPVLFSIATSDHSPLILPEASVSLGTETVSEHILHSDHVSLLNAVALERIAGFLTTQGQQHKTLSSEGTTFDDFRTSPVVLVGGINNAWTLRVTDSLRFHFVTELNPTIRTIEDRQNPGSRDWQVQFSQPYGQLTKDYAIIARLHDKTSEKPVVVAAGLASQGVGAASEFLTSESSMQKLIARLPTHWQDKNVEVVIQTDVINGQPGPPQVLAIYVW